MLRLRPMPSVAAPFRSVVAVLALASLGALSTGCGGHHWAQVKTSKLPPPPAHELHGSRLVIDTSRVSDGAQCVVYGEYSPVCFFDLKNALDGALVRSTWPAFPAVTLGHIEAARPGDYVLQVEVLLDALPPDAAGPGWSAGAKSRYRLLRDGKVLREETLSSRSEAEFPYGAPLGAGASRVIDATVRHIAERVASVPETRKVEAVELPVVAARIIHESAQPKSTAETTTLSLPEASPELAKTIVDENAAAPAETDGVVDSAAPTP